MPKSDGDILDKIIRYENGEMPMEEAVEFFQELVDSGVIFSLQGHYQRTAINLARAGQIRMKSDAK